MSEEQVVRHCAPTLAGLKTGSMFGAWYPSARALREDLRRWNQRLAGKGVCFLPLWRVPCFWRRVCAPESSLTGRFVRRRPGRLSSPWSTQNWI